MTVSEPPPEPDTAVASATEAATLLVDAADRAVEILRAAGLPVDDVFGPNRTRQVLAPAIRSRLSTATEARGLRWLLAVEHVFKVAHDQASAELDLRFDFDGKCEAPDEQRRTAAPEADLGWDIKRYPFEPVDVRTVRFLAPRPVDARLLVIPPGAKVLRVEHDGDLLWWSDDGYGLTDRSIALPLDRRIEQGARMVLSLATPVDVTRPTEFALYAVAMAPERMDGWTPTALAGSNRVSSSWPFRARALSISGGGLRGIARLRFGGRLIVERPVDLLPSGWAIEADLAPGEEATVEVEGAGSVAFLLTGYKPLPRPA